MYIYEEKGNECGEKLTIGEYRGRSKDGYYTIVV